MPSNGTTAEYVVAALEESGDPDIVNVRLRPYGDGAPPGVGYPPLPPLAWPVDADLPARPGERVTATFRLTPKSKLKAEAEMQDGNADQPAA